MRPDVFHTFQNGAESSPLLISQEDLFHAIEILFGRLFTDMDDLLQASITDLTIWDFSEDGSVEYVRKFLEKVIHRPSGAYQVFVLLSIENINDQAVSALLKTLEDVPPRTLFLLTSKTPHLLLPTIRSRIQIISSDQYSQEVDEDVAREVSSFFAGIHMPLVSRILGSNIDRSQCLDIVHALQTKVTDGSITSEHTISRISEVSERLENSNVTPKYHIDSLLFELLA